MRRDTKLRVLVTNARRRKAVPIVRALGKAGMEVTCADSIRHATAALSRYCRGWFRHPDPSSPDFLDAFVRHVRKARYDAIFPLDDDVLQILSANRARLANPDALLLPDHDKLALAADKSLLVPYAGAVGLAAPVTRIVRTAADLHALTDFPLPAIVKPSHGSGSRGMSVARTPQELRRICHSGLALGRTLLVQDRLPAKGKGIGYFALFDRAHNLVAEFMHRRLRENPVSGGPGTFREAIYDDRLAAQGRRLLRSLNWTGLAMVEFKEDIRDGIAKLMEVNPRFWGSIALPIFSGVNFPVLAAKVTAGMHVKPVTEYHIGRKARWFWPGELLHLAASVRRGRWPKGFCDFFRKDICYDLLSVADPLPAPALVLSQIEGRFARPANPPAPKPQPQTRKPEAVMTVDVEDWFHILDSSATPPIEQWSALESRVERNVMRLLELFGRTATRATFFWLGWVAERHKYLVRRCADAGHEIASHGYAHLLAFRVGRDKFRRDVARAKAILEDITGRQVPGIRTAGFGITKRARWAFEEIRRAGHTYDASLFPAARAHGGMADAPAGPHTLLTTAGKLVELPASVAHFAGRAVPLFGGGYLRLAPKWLIAEGIARLSRANRPLVVYVHPREVDPRHPRLALTPRRRFKSYVNLHTTMAKLEWLCRRHSFTTAADLAADVSAAGQPAPANQLAA